MTDNVKKIPFWDVLKEMQAMQKYATTDTKVGLSGQWLTVYNLKVPEKADQEKLLVEGWRRVGSLDNWFRTTKGLPISSALTQLVADHVIAAGAPTTPFTRSKTRLESIRQIMEDFVRHPDRGYSRTRIKINDLDKANKVDEDDVTSKMQVDLTEETQKIDPADVESIREELLDIPEVIEEVEDINNNQKKEVTKMAGWTIQVSLGAMARAFMALVLVGTLVTAAYGWFNGSLSRTSKAVDVVGTEKGGVLIMTVSHEAGEWISNVQPSGEEKFIYKNGSWYTYDGREADTNSLDRLYQAYRLRQEADKVVEAQVRD